MKIRKGFISNSSSSSFICEVCDGDESGWDLSLSDAGMFECVNGHIFHEICGVEITDDIIKDAVKNVIETNISHYQKYFDKLNKLDKNYEYYEKNLKEAKEEKLALDNGVLNLDDAIDEYELRYHMSSLACPICQLETIPDSTVLSYATKKFNFKIDDLKVEIKDKFSTEEELFESLKEKENV